MKNGNRAATNPNENVTTLTYLKYLYKSLYMKVSQTILMLRDYRLANIRRFVLAIIQSKSVVAIKITSNLGNLSFGRLYD